MLATLSDPAAAELCAARLRSEGIPSRLRGESLGPYRLTIGAMAATQVWVPLSRRAEARRLVEESDLGEVDLPEIEREDTFGGLGGRWGAVVTAVVALAAALAVWMLIARFF